MNPFILKATTNAGGNWFVRKVAEISSKANFYAMVARAIQPISSFAFVQLGPGDTLYAKKKTKKINFVAHRLTTCQTKLNC